MKNYKIFFLMIFFGLTYNVECQDTVHLKKNTITYFPFQLDGSISFCYYRKISKYLEFVINPRIKQTQDAPNGNDTWELFLKEPFWYKRFIIRSGLLFQYQNGFFEPMLQYDKGSFNNESRQLEDYEGDQYDIFQSEDQTYTSYGFLGLIGYIKDFKYIRIKIYSGFGSHLKFYHRTLHEKRGYNMIVQENINYPIISDYNRKVISLHGGFEIGFRF
jgi:hypothetical protein